ncbi:MAG: EAL domain-containing protein [Rhizobiaceae bacterium]|nr:EAL domain-containing protein [Rhizobiaceae bacterium]
MTRIVIAVAVFVLLGGAVAFLYGPIEGWPVEMRMLLVSVVTLCMSVAAVFWSLRSERRIAALRTDLSVLARSIDLALRDFAQRNTKDVATLGEMNEHVAHELEKIAAHLLAREDTQPSPPPQPVDNVVALPSTRRGKLPAAADPFSTGADRGTVEAAFRQAIAAGTFDISLQPIVSVSRSAAAGFEAFASLPVEGRGPVDIRRLPGLGSAAFERILLINSLEAGRRRLGMAGEEMPVHAAISDALLNDPQEFGKVIEAITLYPEVSKSVVISMPAPLFGAQRPEADAISRLAGLGMRFAAEGWIEGLENPSEFARAGVGYFKITANRLLDRERSRRRLVPAATIIEAVTRAEITVVATDVSMDEDAVSLIDLGLELMIGERFSGPRRLKPESDPQAKLALV